MKTIQDLKLTKRAEKKVLDWLGEWLKLMIEQANGEEGTVIRADFVEDDFFFFTDCKDLMGEKPESLSVENDMKIRKRKSKVMMQLLLKTLMGEKLGRKSPCTHCGYEDRIVKGMYNGHYVYCPKCKYLVVNGYSNTMKESMEKLIKELEHKEKEKNTKMCNKCGHTVLMKSFNYAVDMCNYCYLEDMRKKVE